MESHSEIKGLVKEKCTQSPAYPPASHPRTHPLSCNPQGLPPSPQHTKSLLANLFIANHSPWKLQIFNFIWHWNRWEASGSQRDKTNLWKEEDCKFGCGLESMWEPGNHMGLPMVLAGYGGSKRAAASWGVMSIWGF